jgi:hypothetical protein
MLMSWSSTEIVAKKGTNWGWGGGGWNKGATSGEY